VGKDSAWTKLRHRNVVQREIAYATGKLGHPHQVIGRRTAVPQLPVEIHHPTDAVRTRDIQAEAPASPSFRIAAIGGSLRLDFSIPAVVLCGRAGGLRHDGAAPP